MRTVPRRVDDAAHLIVAGGIYAGGWLSPGFGTSTGGAVHAGTPGATRCHARTTWGLQAVRARRATTFTGQW